MGCYRQERSGIERDGRKEKLLRTTGKKLYWDWEHRMRTSCTARRPDLTLENSRKKEILFGLTRHVQMSLIRMRGEDKKIPLALL